VSTVTTPGETLDVLVTDEGVAVNPARVELRERLRDAGLPIVTIEQLQRSAAQRARTPAPVRKEGPPVAVVEYRDGTVIDIVRAVDA